MGIKNLQQIRSYPAAQVKTYAKVFPEPVTASTTTSLLPRNIGIAAFWTGVAAANPIADMASNSHSESGGVRALHCRSVCVCGAILASQVSILSLLFQISKL